MKKQILSLLSLLLALSMLIGVFAACDGNSVTTEETTDPETEDSSSDTQGSESSDVSESESSDESETGGNIEVEAPTLTGDNAELIKYANEMANGVDAYYGSSARQNVIVENTEMSFDFNLYPNGNANVTALKNTKGQTYIENTMDVFVKMKNGGTYVASESIMPPTLNMFRLGSYYYEVRFWGQEFLNEITVEDELQFDLTQQQISLKNYGDKKITDDGTLCLTLTDPVDPQIFFGGVKFSTEDYNYIAVTIKIESKYDYNSIAATCFVPTGSYTFTTDDQKAEFYIPADGEYRTYYIPIYKFPDYTGDAKMLRLDLDGRVGDVFYIKDVKAVKGSVGNAPTLSLNRLFHTYSDKLQHVIQITALDQTDNIEKIGMYTKVAVNTVDKLIVKDANGTHDTIEGIDWDTAEYVGFDIKDVGVFGYILLPDETSGKLTVTLEGDNYVIEQSRAPEGNSLAVPTTVGNVLNTKDFYMGQRIYTDETHTFDAFLEEAYCERNPLSEKLISVNTSDSDEGRYLGYNALRGAYEFTMAGSSFTKAFHNEQNKHYKVSFTVKGDNHDRKIYIMGSLEGNGQLECAALLNKNNMLLPVTVEVCKNFSDSAHDLYTIVDAPWSETFFPMVVNAKERTTLNLLHLYQNWGRAPLKQLSSIQFPMPYYHLSTGTTESNCILPWYLTEGSRYRFQFFPDFRGMSGPMYPEQPQHIQAGDHELLQYTDADGNYSAAETVNQHIISTGPTYAEVIMDYVTDDGRMKVSYTHMEMPQTDENRTYYTMTYEVLEDISFKDFKDNFAFYSVRSDGTVDYERVGYLDKNNEFATRQLNTRDRARYYVLGDECPYFTLYYGPNYTGRNGYTNCAFLISDYSFVIGGKQANPNFAIVDLNGKLTLTLNLDEVTFKAGDKFTINAIFLPWGSEMSDYTLEDINVRQVRENSCLNPLTLTADASCTKVDTAFLPTARSTDGLNAEFTISGGYNTTEELKTIKYLDGFDHTGKYYATIRLKGFTELTVPTVWEKVDGEWVRYNLSSNYYPDSSGNTNSYDGYSVHYEDGFFTYSFVVDMTDAKSRTFKFTVDKSKYEAEVEPPAESEVDIYGDGSIVPGLNYVVDANKLTRQALRGHSSLGGVKLSDDGKYVTIKSSSSSNTGYFYPFTFTDVSVPVKTGQYLVIKYRLPESNSAMLPLEIYPSTYEYQIKNEQSIKCSNGLIQDGEWHVLVVDIAKMRPTEFMPQANGAYYARFLQMYLFRGNTPLQIDIEYIAMDDSFEDILEANKDLEEVTYYQTKSYPVKTDGGTLPETEAQDDTSPAPEPFLLYFSPKKIVYNINVYGGSGMGEITLSEDESFMTFGSNAEKGESYYHLFQPSTPTLSGQYLVIKYMTPKDDSSFLEFYVNNKDANAVPSMFVRANNSLGTFTADGNWHITIIDLSKAVSGFTPASDGLYYTRFLRFDTFNKTVGHTDGKLNIGFIGFTDNLEAAIKYDTSVPTVAFYDGTSTTVYDTKTGEKATVPGQPNFVEKNGLVVNEEEIVKQPVEPFQLYGGGTYNTGRYLVFKYKFNKEVLTGQFIVLTATTTGAPTGTPFSPKDADGNSLGLYVDMTFHRQFHASQDGEWHIAVIDLSNGGNNHLYVADSEGNYYAKHVFIQMDVDQDPDATLTIEYIAFSDNLDNIKDYVNGKNDTGLCIHTLTQNGSCAFCGN